MVTAPSASYSITVRLELANRGRHFRAALLRGDRHGQAS
jgi:hypothetical protein